jgi:hypothetical protein
MGGGEGEKPKAGGFATVYSEGCLAVADHKQIVIAVSPRFILGGIRIKKADFHSHFVNSY